MYCKEGTFEENNLEQDIIYYSDTEGSSDDEMTIEEMQEFTFPLLQTQSSWQTILSSRSSWETKITPPLYLEVQDYISTELNRNRQTLETLMS